MNHVKCANLKYYLKYFLQIFIEDKQVYVNELQKISVIDEMTDALRKISNLLPCPGIGIAGKEK